MKKKILLAMALPLFLVGCDSAETNEPTSSKEINYETYYEDIEDRVSYDMQNENNFVQTMENGLNDDIFYSLEGAWHTDVAGGEHNGMKHRNLFYTNDGTNDLLAIKGRGYYNREEGTIDGKPEGGCIVTKNHLGPGRYEIQMAAMPREGGVTAMWTYCTTTGSEASSQNEIDIEIGGTTNATNFESMWCTSWVKKTLKQTDTVDVTEDLYLNDGKIHTYTFDWYTNYNDEDVKRVDWFIDGKLIDSIEGNVVPEHEMPLWIGLWFPPLWSGQASFESDYLLIKEISYTAFDETQYYETCRSEPGYNKIDPSDANIQTLDYSIIKNLNKLSNSTFESLDIASKDDSYYGWKVDTASSGSVELTEGKSGNGFKLNAGTNTSDAFHGQYLKQTLTNAFEGYKYSFSIDAKKYSSESSGNVEIYIKNATGKTIEKEIIPVESLEYTTITRELVLPENAYQIEIDITAEDGSICYDNASLIFKA
ncbi:MAG: glycoside hydrolase family 16 protein [Acholeplasmatales bacterium]|nr:glycoside hydrolase family 16 protein [Acholeplasmatales bacterium]